MDRLAEYLDPDGAAAHLRQLAAQIGATEYALVRNLDYVYAPGELLPLAPRIQTPLEQIVAFAVDMDGTSTTTEPLALHALEYMVRRFTGRPTKADWAGLDPQRDYPHVIGNSNFRHTEFLLERYRAQLDRAALRQAFFEALCWTLACMPDQQRRRDVTRNARNCGLTELLEDADFGRLVHGQTVDANNVGTRVMPFVHRFGNAFRCDQFGELVPAALDIYYLRYHSILRLIEQGRGQQLSRELLGESGRRLIEPMPGYDVFLPLIKGWLGPESHGLYELLRAQLPHGTPPDSHPDRLARLAGHFRRQPAKLAVVTASISYEAHTSMKEVIALTGERVRNWPIAAAHRERVAQRLTDYAAVFDGFVNATDACEHRLKPHRDLYSLALQQMSIPKQDYGRCVGLEDTEPGIIALRAAGLGCAVALPNRDTSRQDYSAATMVVPGGLPELILEHNLLLPKAET
jgi:beta-phosphoglucomutase-like phosphatase (HAD superfamily)